MPNKQKKKKNKEKIKYIDKLFYRIFLSTFLLLILVISSKIDKFKNILNIEFQRQISFTKIAYTFTNFFPTFIEPIGDVTVFESVIYDNVTYEEKVNKVINSSFDGVVNLCDSVVMKICENENGLYEVHTINKDGYTYIYKNLESIDINIYSYLESGTILGRSSYDKINNNYKFDLIISKKGDNYSFYEMAED